MVLLDRIELSTSSLPMTRSTTELQQQPDRPPTHVRWAGAAYGGASLACQDARLDDAAISRAWPPSWPKHPPPPISSANAVWPKRCEPICASARRRLATQRPKHPLKTDRHRHFVALGKALRLAHHRLDRQQPAAAFLMREHRRLPTGAADFRLDPRRAETLASIEPLTRYCSKANAVSCLAHYRYEKPCGGRSRRLPAPERRRDGESLQGSICRQPGVPAPEYYRYRRHLRA